MPAGHTARTPYRVLKWLQEYGEPTITLAEALSTDRSLFPETHDEMVAVHDISFTSLCAHHLLPFRGKAAVGYIPNGKVIGISKLARAVKYFAERITLQEYITAQTADGLQELLQPQGVVVVLYDVEHQCMTIRGVKDTHAKTTTSSVRGFFFENRNNCKTEFFQMVFSK